MQSIYSTLLIVFLCSVSAQAQTPDQIARERITTLETLIAEAENAGKDALKEKVTVRTAEIFLDFADWDEQNIAENTGYFELVAIYRDSAQQMAELLPDFERNDVIVMLDAAIDYLGHLNRGDVTRKTIPNPNWSLIDHEGDQLTYEGLPVFLSDYTWKPDVPANTDYHGNQDGFFLTPSYVTDENGTIRSKIANELNNKPDGTAGFIFINNKNVPAWAKTKYGDGFEMRLSTFTNYDIDAPGATKRWNG